MRTGVPPPMFHISCAWSITIDPLSRFQSFIAHASSALRTAISLEARAARSSLIFSGV